MDFNVVYENFGQKDENIIEKVKKAFELGYETVAINTIIDSTVLSEKNVRVPEPPEVSAIIKERKDKRLKVLTRLTAVIKDGIHGHHLMQCPATKKYDIIAVRPVGEKMVQHVCANLDVDIISLDLGEKLPFSFKRTYLGQAREKNIVFEIEYAPCLRDQSMRRCTIANTQILVDVSKYRNIIVSSGALNVLELRGVSDVINLCYLFGFNHTQARNAVVTTGKTVLSHSATRRRTGCGYVSVEEMFKLAHQDRWLISACRIPRKIENVTDTDESAKQTKSPPSKKQKR